jgi:hypothetical protein
MAEEPLHVELHPRQHRMGPWAITVELADVDGRLECVGISVRSSSSKSLTAEAFRGVRLGRVVDLARRNITARTSGSMGQVTRVDLAKDAQAELDRRDFSKGGAHGLPPRELARVADVYAQAWREGRKPTQAVAKRFHITPSAAAKRVHRARQLGLLSATTKGKPSGGMVRGRTSLAVSGEMKAKATVRKSKRRKAREAE